MPLSPAYMLYLFGFAAICLAWLLPGHFFPWPGFQQETLAAVGAVLLTLGALLTTGERRLEMPSAAALTLGLAIVPVVQWWTGRIPFFADALLPALYLCAFALTIVAASASTRAHGERFVVGLFAAMLIAALVSAGIGLAQWLQLGEIAYVERFDGGRVYGNFTQPNHLASLLGLGFVAALWCFETRRIGPIGASLALALISFVAITAQSRTSWVLVMVLIAWWLVMRRRLALRTSSAAIVLGLAGLIAAVAVLEPLSAALQLSGGTSLSERAQAGTRPIHWATLWDAAWRQPWWGHGWQQVGVAQQSATLDHPAAHEWITFSHNLVLDLMVWNGAVPGLLLSAVAARWALRRILRCRDIHSCSLLAAGSVLVVHALVEFPLAYAYFLLPFGLMIGAVHALESKHPATVRFQLPRWVFASAVTGMAAMLFWICVEFLAVEEEARAMAFKEAGYVTKGPGPQLPDVVLLDNQREFIWFRMTPAAPDLDAATLSRMKTLSQRFAPPAAMLRYALAAGLNGRESDAARTLALICHMWPTRNCDEGRGAWAAAQQQYPALQAIAFPETRTAPH